jgi:hypothetical protein
MLERALVQSGFSKESVYFISTIHLPPNKKSREEVTERSGNHAVYIGDGRVDIYTSAGHYVTHEALESKLGSLTQLENTITGPSAQRDYCEGHVCPSDKLLQKHRKEIQDVLKLYDSTLFDFSASNITLHGSGTMAKMYALSLGRSEDESPSVPITTTRRRLTETSFKCSLRDNDVHCERKPTRRALSHEHAQHIHVNTLPPRSLDITPREIATRLADKSDTNPAEKNDNKDDTSARSMLQTLSSPTASSEQRKKNAREVVDSITTMFDSIKSKESSEYSIKRLTKQQKKVPLYPSTRKHAFVAQKSILTSMTCTKPKLLANEKCKRLLPQKPIEHTLDTNEQSERRRLAENTNTEPLFEEALFLFPGVSTPTYNVAHSIETEEDGYDAVVISLPMKFIYRSNIREREFDLSNWDTRRVTNMTSMFRGCVSTNGAENWDVSSVTDMSFMFEHSET